MPLMTTTDVVILLLALSFALNVALGAGCVAKASGKTVWASILIAGGAAGAILTIFFAALSVYRS